MLAIHIFKKIPICDLACFCCEGRLERDCLLGEGNWPFAYYLIRSFLFKEIELRAQGMWANNIVIDAVKEEICPPQYKAEREN
ncbi:MAG: hypothetical protein N3B16_07990 [Candidatus Aminicenantes bacterium]|nr:hypothetical protein [Candidatus Aminicenantes bacterium]